MALILCSTPFSSFQYGRLSPSIVQARLENYSKSRFAFDAIYNSVKLLESFRFAFLHEAGHEICELDASPSRVESGRQHVCLAFVVLLGREFLAGRQLESSTFPYVE